MKIAKGTAEIRSVADWFRVAPPAKGEKHWVDGRSAKELARAWFPTPGEPITPPELLALLLGPSTLGATTLEQGEPEALVYFDDLRGLPRHSDLVLTGNSALGPIVISVEAKADEPFGKLVRDELEASDHGRRKGRSHLRERVDRLAAALFGSDRSAVLGCRYQLLYGAAAALSAGAGRAQAAVFVVHEFTGPATDEAKSRENHADLEHFVAMLSAGTITAVRPGQLYGPFHVPGNAHVPATIPLFIGKVTRHL